MLPGHAFVNEIGDRAGHDSDRDEADSKFFLL
jgi:hypothetical protein